MCFPIDDIRENYEFMVKELKKLNNTYDINDLETLKFKKKEKLNYIQIRINVSELLKMEHDEVGREILRINKKEILSHFFQKNYNYTIYY